MLQGCLFKGLPTSWWNHRQRLRQPSTPATAAPATRTTDKASDKLSVVLLVASVVVVGADKLSALQITPTTPPIVQPAATDATNRTTGSLSVVSLTSCLHKCLFKGLTICRWDHRRHRQHQQATTTCSVGAAGGCRCCCCWLPPTSCHLKCLLNFIDLFTYYSLKCCCLWCHDGENFSRDNIWALSEAVS